MRRRLFVLNVKDRLAFSITFASEIQFWDARMRLIMSVDNAISRMFYLTEIVKSIIVKPIMNTNVLLVTADIF